MYCKEYVELWLYISNIQKFSIPTVVLLIMSKYLLRMPGENVVYKVGIKSGLYILEKTSNNFLYNAFKVNVGKISKRLIEVMALITGYEIFLVDWR